MSKVLRNVPVNQPEIVDQSDSFLPTTELAYKEVSYFQNWLNKRNSDIVKHENKLEKSCTYFLALV